MQKMFGCNKPIGIILNVLFTEFSQIFSKFLANSGEFYPCGVRRENLSCKIILRSIVLKSKCFRNKLYPDFSKQIITFLTYSSEYLAFLSWPLMFLQLIV